MITFFVGLRSDEDWLGIENFAHVNKTYLTKTT